MYLPQNQTVKVHPTNRIDRSSNSYMKHDFDINDNCTFRIGYATRGAKLFYASSPYRIPTRFNVSIMLFMACLISYMLRVNMSVNILAMVQPIQSSAKQPVPANTTSDFSINRTTLPAVNVPDYGPRYNWTSHDQSIILGAYFYGYLVSSLPAGVFAERFGGRNMVGLSLAFSALLTALTPLAAEYGMWATIVNRVILGVLGGFLYPALHNLISKWAPPDEKGKFVSALMGGTFGTVITWPLVGVLIETVGWSFAFYIPAVISAIVAALWYIIVADSPSSHPRINAEERDYIEKSLGDTVSKSKLLPPIASLATSLPFLALLVLHFGNLWGLYFLITAAPKFMSEVPHIIPGLFLVGLIYIGFDPYVCVAIITLSLGFNGASTMTNLQNSQDLAPNFAGTLYGIINFVGTSSGFISPILVAHFTVDRSTMDEWKYVFMIGATAYIIPALVFVVFGSGQVQKWNEPKQKPSSTKPDEA
ncbi:hypothetical protein ZHAS_00015886 [Anopheles sinensis]|uniref:MFS domain-containing protein n=1 Tax=Anopheles sinensis TaxID=74873 RepID=A0A084WC96_ANOSI|nr:hypothetical protein ZHAS_00015886 [Anopheles sinensis]